MARPRTNIAEVATLFESFAKPPKLLLVDGSNLLIRSIKALEHTNLSNSEGVSTAAIHAYISSLAGHVATLHPTHVIVCWDGGKSAYRTGVFPEYKANRHSAVEERQDAFDLATEFHTLAGIQQEKHDGWEADDLIACYANDTALWPHDIMILSGDKDLLQLVDDLRVMQIRPGQEGHWNRRRVVKEYGVEPSQLALVLALMGDTSDNVPGIHGIGVKTAAKLIVANDGDIEAICAKGGKRLCAEDVETIKRNLLLVDLSAVPGRPVVTPPQEFQPGSADGAGLQAWLSRYELQQVLARWREGRLWTR